MNEDDEGVDLCLRLKEILSAISHMIFLQEFLHVLLREAAAQWVVRQQRFLIAVLIIDGGLLPVRCAPGRWAPGGCFGASMWRLTC
jgi:hypothetical protein